jgi:radical SAM protein with 4Fe4S-binding SPASM domain
VIVNLKNRISRLLGRKPLDRVGRRPETLVVEPTNRCNLNCPFCLVGLQNQLGSAEHSKIPRGFGFMDFGLYEKIVKDAVDFGTKKIQLHFQGESLLHKQFPEMIRLAKQYGMSTQVFTNGLLLTMEYIDSIIQSGLDNMRFSVDGASDETYKQNRVGGDFEKVLDNMKMMTEHARGSGTRVEWQFIVMRNNEHELNKAQQMAREIGVPFIAKTFAESVPELTPDNPKYRRNLLPKPCTDIYRAVAIFWNGDVVPCCYDLVGKEIMGNIGERTLSQIWDSAKYAAFRYRVDNAGRNPDDEPELCKTCLKWGHVQPLRPGQGTTTVKIETEDV